MGQSEHILQSYVFKYKPYLIGSAILNLGYSLFTLVSIPLLIPFFHLLFDSPRDTSIKTSQIEVYLFDVFQNVIEEFGQEGALIRVCILFVLAIILRNAFRYFSLYVMAAVRNGIVSDLRVSLFGKIFRLPISYFNDEKKGDIISKSISDVTEVEWSILNFIEVIFRSPILLLGSLSIMLFISPFMTIIVLILVIITVVIIYLIGRPIKTISKNTQIELGLITSKIEEGVSSVRIVKSYNAESAMIHSFNQHISKFKDLMIRAFRLKDLGAPISESLGMAIVGTIMGIGATQVFDQKMSPEAFFAFIFAFYQVIEPAKALSRGYFNVRKGIAAAERINEILNISEVNDEGPNSMELLEPVQKINFENVIFHYEKDNEAVLNDISFVIEQGQKVALVGASGSGKTTIINILNRFYSPDSGMVKINGENIERYTTSSIRNKIGLVSQESVLFNDTVRNNLTFGKAGFSDNQLYHALKSAFALDFVKDLPNKINEVIGDNGMKLSGGQKQRLNIARAILHDPEILIFDEATSALDSASEKIVQKSIDELTKGRTSLVIAHRLSTIINSDLIILLEKGRIVGHGTHNKLLNENKLYQKLVEYQFL
jgi:subfamily B ATP-binding cassette protein MsbA